MSFSPDQNGDAGALSTGWSVTCGLMAAAAGCSVGNMPTVVLAVSVTAADLIRRIAGRVAHRRYATALTRARRVDGGI
jgi:hypothetical protein